MLIVIVIGYCNKYIILLYYLYYFMEKSSTTEKCTTYATTCHIASYGWWKGDVGTPFHHPQLAMWRVVVQVVHYDCDTRLFLILLYWILK